MQKVLRYIIPVSVLVALAVPLYAYALPVGFSFGGRIALVTPCANGALLLTVISARLVPKPEFYIWDPTTITLGLPPTPPHPGQEIVGLSDYPDVCFVGITLFGGHIGIEGSSVI